MMIKMTKLKKLFSPVYYQWRNLTTHHKHRDELHEYWIHPWDDANAPRNYLQPRGGERRSLFLLELVNSYATDKESTVLEIGCSVGRNLNQLFSAGYKKLAGIEISEDAIALMKEAYPEMANQTKIYCSPVEDAIKCLEYNSFSIVFTMAVLEHIHPDSQFVFREMVRITSEYLVTIEDEKGISWRSFPRNYKRIFESLGMKQVYQFNCSETEGLGSNFSARVFRKV